MDLGVFLPYQVFSVGHEADTVYDRMLDIAKVADEAGFKYVWTPEHSFIHLLPSPSALLPAVQVSQHVRCRVGTAVLVLPYHDPLILAGEIAAADQLMNGRLEVGVARGAYRYEFEKLGIDFARGREIFVEKLQAIEALLDNEATSTTIRGEFVDIDGAFIWPRPVQRPRPPIWIGAQTLPSIEDAARRGYNVMHSLMLWDESHLVEVKAAFDRGREAGGHTASRLAVTRFGLVVSSEAEVQEALDRLLHGWRIHMRLHDFTEHADDRGVVESVPHPTEPDREVLTRNLLIGTRAEVSQRLRYYEELGIDIVNLNPAFGMPHDKVLEGLAEFAEFI